MDFVKFAGDVVTIDIHFKVDWDGWWMWHWLYNNTGISEFNNINLSLWHVPSTTKIFNNELNVKNEITLKWILKRMNRLFWNYI